MAWVDRKAKDFKDIEKRRLKHGFSCGHHGHHPPPPPIMEVHYKPRPARDDPSEPFVPWQRNLRECTQWDPRGHRFLVSIFDGGMGAVPIKPGCPADAAASLPEEKVLVPHAPRPGLSNLGFRIDYPRNRVVSCASDKFNYSLSTIAAYDYTTWETLFVVELQAGEDNKSLADDLTIDPAGNLYVTDTYGGKIWKVTADGSHFSIFCNDPVFQVPPVNQYYGWTKLNGILYHPQGFFLVTHMASHALFKVSMDGKKVTTVGGLSRDLLGDGIALVNENKLVMAGLDVGVHILVTSDNWETAVETENSPAPSSSILPTCVTFKDGCIFVGLAKLELTPYNTIAQPVFQSVT